MTVRTLIGDCREILQTLDAASFDCIVTSPPYWGLRDYGVEGQIGLEPTLDGYVDEIAGVARELWRVLKPTGTFWLNLGDSYNNCDKWGGGGANTGKHTRGVDGEPESWKAVRRKWGKIQGLKPKDLCMVPARVALRLQADGWWIRSEIIWAKPNPMPESVTDRPTSAHEKVWLLAKSDRYFYDAQAIKEPAIAAHEGEIDGGAQRARDGSNANVGRNYRDGKQARIGAASPGGRGRRTAGFNERWDASESASGPKFTRNARNVWTIAAQPFRGAHFATMPPALVERCILAGCPVGGSALDPFSGAGTTGLVADRLQRDATLIELNPAYIDLQTDRIRADAPLFADVTAE